MTTIATPGPTASRLPCDGHIRQLLVASLVMVVLFTIGGCSAAATRNVAQATASAATPAESLAPPVSTPPYECKFTEDAIAINGTLDEAAWRSRKGDAASSVRHDTCCSPLGGKFLTCPELRASAAC